MSGRHVEQRDLVGAFELARIEHDLLPVAHIKPTACNSKSIAGSTTSTPTGMSATPCSSQDRFDLLARPAHQPDLGINRAAQAEHPGVAIMLRQPGREQPMMLGGRAEIPEMRLAVAGEQRVAR